MSSTIGGGTGGSGTDGGLGGTVGGSAGGAGGDDGLGGAGTHAQKRAALHLLAVGKAGWYVSV